MNRIKNLLLASAVLLSLPTSAALANSVDAAPAAVTADQGADSGDIVVTARRREESLQSVPTAITALSSKALESRSITDVRQLSGFSPNVNIQSAVGSASGAQIFLRGVGLDATGFTSDPNVGIYLDDIFIGRLVGSLVGALDLERIEILRGPQGTLYGRNSTAGAVKYVTRKPDLDENSGKLSATLGSQARRTFRGGANLVIKPGVLALRLEAQTRDEDGYVKLFDAAGKDTGMRANATHAQDYRAALRYRPDPNLTIDLTGDYSVNHPGLQVLTAVNCNILPRVAGLGADGKPALISAGQFQSCPYYYGAPNTAFVGIYPPNDPLLRSGGGSATVSYDLGFATLKYVGGYRGFHDIQARALNAAPPPEQTNNQRQDLQQRQWQQELQLSGNAADWLGFTVGLFYYRERIKAVTQSQAGAFNTTTQSYPAYRLNKDTQITNSYAAYGEFYLRPVTGLELTVGGRYSKDKKSVDRGIYTAAASNYTVNTAPYTDSFSTTKFTPKLGVSYKTGDVMVFASYSEGYRSAGYTSPTPANAVDEALRFGIESENSYEAGFKSTLFDRKLMFNVTAFTSKYKNLQATLVVNGQNVVVTSDVRIKGLEVETSFRPTSNLTIFGNLGLLDDHYITPPAGQPYAVKLKHAVEESGMLGFDYEVPVESLGGTLFLGGDAQFTGRAYRNVANTIDERSEPFTLFNARVGYRSADDRWTITAGGTNLTDKLYFTTGTQNVTRGYQPGRKFYVTAEVRF